ncbi:threonine-phosphate decarboxylase [Emcibacter sp.]|uniref:threonine-phosphate decarboxylase n=1 Tax=Emcibacter sp. TaxID=1979954 RepID=UPI003A8CD5C7
MKKRVHGGDLAEAMDLYPTAPVPWIDLSTGINPNPWPWTEKVPMAELEAAAARLPGGQDMEFCRTACAQYLGVEDDHVTLTPGSQAAIEMLPLCVDAGRDVYIPGPTYSEHGLAWHKNGHRVHHIPYDWDIMTFLPEGSVLVLTHPNNPDGRKFDPEKLYLLCLAHIERGGTVIIDEAFADIEPGLSLLNFPLREGLVVLRSAGKFSGLAGLRLGAVVATGSLKENITAKCPLWEISTLTLRVFGHFYRDHEWIAGTREALAGEMDRLAALLSTSGFRVVGSTLLYCLVEAEDAAARAEHLLREGIYVRTFPENSRHLRFGLPGSEAAWKRLEQQLKRKADDCAG